MKPVIVITGVSRGIGLAIAKAFDAIGFRIIGCAKNLQTLAVLQTQFPQWKLYACDVSQKKEIQQFAQIVLAETDSIEILVNNAGKFIPGSIHSEEDSIFEELMQTNLNSAYYLTKALLPVMQQAKRGTIFNLCSIASLIAYPNGGSYCISKFALLGFSKVLREELKPWNIRVVSVMPGATFTDSWAGIDLPENRFISVEDLANLLVTVYQLREQTVVEEIVIRPLQGDI